MERDREPVRLTFKKTEREREGVEKGERDRTREREGEKGERDRTRGRERGR